MDYTFVLLGSTLVFSGLAMASLAPRLGSGGTARRVGFVTIVGGLGLTAAGVFPGLQDSAAFLMACILAVGTTMGWVSVSAIRSARAYREREKSEAARLEEAVSRGP